MKTRIIPVILLLFFISAGSFAQINNSPSASTGDTALVPYWIQMMQDPNANFFRTQRAFELYWQDRPVTKGCGWKVFKRWEYKTRFRISPDGTLPAPDAVTRALAEAQDVAPMAAGSWTSLGPSVIPAPGPAGYEGIGRLNVVAFHPTDANKIYVGAPSGGFWMSSNGGTSWSTSTDSLATLGVSAIVVDYSTPSKILIGTGDRDAGDAPGMGVYKSLNGGLSWTVSNTGMGTKTVGKLIQDPTNAQIFLAATSGGIYRSTDGGANWTQTRTGNFKDICFKPGDPSIVYAATAADFYRSTNNGQSFSQITSGLSSGQRGAIAVTAANPAYVYFVQSNNSSGFQGLYRSTDSGLNFTTRSTTPNILDWSCNGGGSGGQGWYDLAIAADPTNAEIIYVGGVDVWKSTNGGQTWAINSHWYGGCSVPAVHADCHFLGYSPVNGKLYAGNDGGVYWTSNGGTNWTDITVGMTIGQMYKISQAQTVKQQVIAGHQDNGTYTLYPTGWEATGGGDGMECAIDFQNAAYMYHTIYYGDIFRTINNGSEVQVGGNGIGGITEDGAWVTPFILSKSDPKIMFAGFKNIWRCNDIKATSPSWTKISNNLGGSNSTNLCDLEQSPANTSIVYASRYDNKLFRSDNALAGSVTWTDLTSTLPATGTVADLAAHPTDQNTVYIVLGTGVYKSINKGTSWTNITGTLPAVQKNAIVYYKNGPTEALYVGTDAGVYYRDQTTGAWITYNSGLPLNAIISELDIYYDNDSVSADVIRAGTYGRGLWSSPMYNPYTADFTADSTGLCEGQNADFTDLSTATPTSWVWSFPGGTPSSSTAQHPQNIVYSSAGAYSVTLTSYYNTIPVTVTKNNYINVTAVPASPAQPQGDTLLCENNANTQYSITAVPGATGYIWSLNPPAAGVLTPAGTSVTINWDDSFTGYATLTVQSTGTCGNSAPSTGLSIHLRPFPATPGTPSGPASLCQGAQPTDYTISPAANADSYVWLLTPPSAGTITGSGTTGTVSWDPLFTGTADISVKAVNACNESGYSTALQATLLTTPAVDLGADLTLLQTQTAVLDAGNPGSAYLWSTGETTQTITAGYLGNPADTYFVDVTANNCTGSDTIVVNFTVTGVPGNPGNGVVKVSPNPNNGRFRLEIRLPEPATLSITVISPLGTEVYSRKDLTVNTIWSEELQLDNPGEGIYYLIIKGPGNHHVLKVVLEK